MRHLFISLPCILIFFFLSLFVGMLEESVIFQSIALVIFSLLFIPVYYTKFPKKWSVWRRLRTHLVFAVTVILLLNLGYVFRLGVQKTNSFAYRLAHLSGPFRTVYSTSPVQYVINEIYQLAPMKERIDLYQLEDISRVHRIRKEASDDFSRSLMCADKDRGLCFINIIRTSSDSHPIGTAGTIAVYEEGADLVVGKPDLGEKLSTLVTSLNGRKDTFINLHVPGVADEVSYGELTEMVNREEKVRHLLSETLGKTK